MNKQAFHKAGDMNNSHPVPDAAVLIWELLNHGNGSRHRPLWDICVVALRWEINVAAASELLRDN